MMIEIVLVYLCLSISTIRASRTQMEMKKILMFFDNQSGTDMVRILQSQFRSLFFAFSL
jgi:hypothetical protein